MFNNNKLIKFKIIWKIMMTKFNMSCDAHYHAEKFKIKIQFEYGETNKINCIMGWNELNNIV